MGNMAFREAGEVPARGREAANGAAVSGSTVTFPRYRSSHLVFRVGDVGACHVNIT